jgi:hypothetical protein
VARSTKPELSSTTRNRVKRATEHRLNCNYCGEPSTDYQPTIPYADGGCWFHASCLEAFKAPSRMTTLTGRTTNGGS